MNALRKTLLIATLCAAPVATAAAMHHDARAATPSASTASSATLTSGEVRKVDLETNKITIRHGAIENLGMPPMTMVFRVADPSHLEGLKAGDKIRFRAENRQGAYVATAIERAN